MSYPAIIYSKTQQIKREGERKEKNINPSKDGKFLNDSFRSIYNLCSSKSSEDIGILTKNVLYTLNAKKKENALIFWKKC